MKNINFQKGFIVPLIIGIIAVLAIGAVGYFSYEKGKSVQVVQETNLVVSTSSIATVSTSNQIQTSSTSTSPCYPNCPGVGMEEGTAHIQSISQPSITWKTYTNTSYGFQIQYPSNSQLVMNVTTPGGQDFSFSISNRKMEILVQTNVLNGAYSPVCNSPAGVDPYQNKIINGISFANYQADKFYSSGNVSATATEYCVMHNGIGYILAPQLQYTSGTAPVDVNSDPVLNQMLSSFKFTNSLTPEPSITVISPNGGEVWKAGASQTITVNITGDSNYPGNYAVGLFLVDSSGNASNGYSLGGGLVANVSGPKSFQVTLPTNYIGNDKIYAVLSLPATPTTCQPGYVGCASEPQIKASDFSDNYFTVIN